MSASTAERRASGIYRGEVEHVRLGEPSHAFRYRMFMLYLDLDELDDVFRGRWLWSVGRWNLASWRRRDYLGDPQAIAQAQQAVADQARGKPQK